MSKILYEENPSMIRSHPLGTVIAILLIPVGVGILILLYWYLTMKADKLTIKEDEVIWTHGLLSKQYVEINMASIRTTKVQQSLLQQLDASIWIVQRGRRSCAGKSSQNGRPQIAWLP